MSETHTAAQPGRNMALDNSRTIGCFLIVVVHACMSGWYGMDPSSALWKFNLGGIAASYAAVSLFFMISGALFLVPRRYVTVRSLHRGQPLRHLYPVAQEHIHRDTIPAVCLNTLVFRMRTSEIEGPEVRPHVRIVQQDGILVPIVKAHPPVQLQRLPGFYDFHRYRYEQYVPFQCEGKDGAVRRDGILFVYGDCTLVHVYFPYPPVMPVIRTETPVEITSHSIAALEFLFILQVPGNHSA